MITKKNESEPVVVVFEVLFFMPSLGIFWFLLLPV